MSDFLSEFTTAELMEGIDLYCQMKLNMPTQKFVDRVHAGETFEPATQEIADLVRIVDQRVDNEKRMAEQQEVSQATVATQDNG